LKTIFICSSHPRPCAPNRYLPSRVSDPHFLRISCFPHACCTSQSSFNHSDTSVHITDELDADAEGMTGNN